MGCCCGKEVDEDDERSRLLNSQSVKSRFNENSNGQLNNNNNKNQQNSNFTNLNGNHSNGGNNLNGGMLNSNGTNIIGGVVGGGANNMNAMSKNSYLNANFLSTSMGNNNNNNLQQQNDNSILDSTNANYQQDHMFEKMLSEVINVTTLENRSNLMQDESNHQVHEIPNNFMRGLLEPVKQQQLTLPEGVIAPATVLAAQPPFSNDIKLINAFAAEANACINGYALQVPENVAFNFNPLV